MPAGSGSSAALAAPSATTVAVPRVGDLHVAQSGSREGTPVLLLHGIGSSSASFSLQLAEFDGDDDLRLIAWDAPGYGRSADPVGRLDMAGYATAAWSLLDGLGLGHAHLVGVSWGGVVATRMALQAAGRTLSLALLGSTVGRAGSVEATADLHARADALERTGPRGFAAARADRVLSPQASPVLREQVRETMAAVLRPRGYRMAGDALAATNHEADLATIAVPALILSGLGDAITGEREARRLAQGLPAARLVLLPEAGHLVNQEAAAAVNRELRSLWERATRTSSQDQGDPA